MTGIALNFKYDPQSINSIVVRKAEKPKYDSVSVDMKSLYVSSIQYFSSKIFLISMMRNKKIFIAFRGVS